MRRRWGVLLLLGCLSWTRGEAQSGATPESIRCRAGDIELYDGGDDTGLGRSEQVIELRNRSQRTCTLLGPPELLFFDEYGKRVANPYGRNQGGSMSTAEPVRLVTLQPGEFAHFKVGTTSCNSGQECLHFNKLQVVLPGDYVPLNVGRSISNFQGVNVTVTAVRTGADTEDGGWVPPVAPVEVFSGGMTGLSLRLDVPQHPVEGVRAHFALRNEGTDPVQVVARSCGLTERLTNSAETTITAEQSCGTWTGPLGSDGRLEPGAVATMEMNIAGADRDPIQGKMCRAGRWTAELELATDVGKVRFHPVQFEVKEAQCSDSDLVEVPGAEAIHWTPTPQHGVRLGLLVRARGNTEPGDGRSVTGLEEAAFQAGESIELRFFLDNVTDEPMRLNVGQGTFRLQVRPAGLDAPAEWIAPTRAQTNRPAKDVTVPPHTEKQLGMRVLNDTYNLPAGDYELQVGLHLTGAAAMASASTGGSPPFEEAATVGGLIKVLPQ